MMTRAESVVNTETSFIRPISINRSMSSCGILNIKLIFFIKICRLLILQLLMNFNSVTDSFNLFTIVFTSFALLHTSYISIFIEQKSLFEWVLLLHRNKHSNPITITVFFSWSLLFFTQSILNFLITSSDTLSLIDYIRNFFSVS